MKNIILVLFVLLYTLLPAQNLIQNGDFEDCLQSSGECDYAPQVNPSYSPFNEFQFVDGYGSVWKEHYTPDWYKNPTACNRFDPSYPDENICITNIAQHGSKCIGFASNEAIIYDFGSEELPSPDAFVVTLWVKGEPYNSDGSSAWGIRVFAKGSGEEPHYSSGSCNSDNSNLIFSQSFPSSDYTDWHKVEFYVETVSQDIRYLMFTGIPPSDCANSYTYTFVDNVYMEKSCCNDHQVYQNCNYLPPVTQREYYIAAGETGLSPYQGNGPVTVKATDNITFSAANYILMQPGFNVVYPGVFTAETVPSCAEFPDRNASYPITYLGMTPELIVLTCNEGDINGLGFASTGATFYRVLVDNPSNEVLLDKTGEIHDIYTVVWNGQESLHLAQPNGTVTISLTLFNCFEQETITNELPYEYSGCYPDGIIMPHNKVDSTERNAEIKIYPNPASNKLNLLYIGDSIQEIKCYNVLGQLLIDQNNFPSASPIAVSDYVINTGNLATGTYLLNIITNSGVISKKFIKQ